MFAYCVKCGSAEVASVKVDVLDQKSLRDHRQCDCQKCGSRWIEGIDNRGEKQMLTRFKMPSYK
jgi:DNA-directed RNA polymerase subunit RPC12/RpoP